MPAVTAIMVPPDRHAYGLYSATRARLARCEQTDDQFGRASVDVMPDGPEP
jgi:hypothetical protein